MTDATKPEPEFVMPTIEYCKDRIAFHKAKLTQFKEFLKALEKFNGEDTGKDNSR